MKKNLSHLPLLKKLPIACIGTFGVGFAMACMYRSNAGADPVTVLICGIAKALSCSQGSASTLLNLSFFLFALAFNRSSVGYATLVSVLLMGKSMDFSVLLLRWALPVLLPYPAGLLLMTIGSVLMGASIGLYLSLGIGSSPADGMMLWVHKALKIRYRFCTWIFFFVCLCVGYLLGEPLYLGTLIAMLVVGLTCDFTLSYLQENQNK